MTLCILSVGAAEIFRSGFEEPSAGSLYTVILSGSGVDGWTVENGSIEVVGTYWVAAVGNQSVDLSGIHDWAGTISRDVITTPGNWYKLKFAFAGNPADAAIKQAQVFWGGAKVADLSVDTTGRSFTDMGWKYYEYTLQATGEVTQIKFQSLTLNALGPVIDDVSLEDAAAPNPSVTLTANMFAGVWLEGPAGTTQQLQVTTDSALQAGWRTLITVKLPAEGKLFFLDPEPATAERKYYRTIAGVGAN